MFSLDDFTSVSVEELKSASNWQSQYRLITQWGSLILPKQQLRVDEHLLKGCETSAWLAHDVEHNRHRFAFDSDSRVIKGLAVLLLAQAEGKTTQEIQTINFAQLLIDVGLEKHLTPSRNNGLKAIIARIESLVD